MTEITGEKRLRLRKSAQPIRNPSAAYSKKCANFRTMKLPSGEPRILAKIPRTLSLMSFDWLPSRLESQNMHPAHAAANNQKKTASTMRTVRFSGSIYLSLFSFFILSVLRRYENKINCRALRVNAQAVDALRRCKIARGYEHREHRAEREQSALRAAASLDELRAA